MSTQRTISARYYLFEDLIERTPGFAHLRKRVPMAKLHLLAGLVWARESGRGPCPPLEPIKGDTSYFDHRRRVVQLAPPHRNAAGVLHELAHALGTRDKLTHGPAFQARCLRLYKLYGDWSGQL